MRRMRTLLRFQVLLSILVMAFLAGGCQRAYYGAMEKIGYHKRDILVDRVEDARDAQQEAKEQFRSALERFTSVVQVDGGELEEKYKKLDAELQSSEQRARQVRERIDEVEDVAEALFDEWKAELDQYSNAELRRSSQQRLRQTRSKYEQLITAMRRAESRMDPVLDSFRDQVLFLKHNLNARAIASLHSELGAMRGDIEALVRDMERSIQEADAFVQSLSEND